MTICIVVCAPDETLLDLISNEYLVRSGLTPH